MVLAQGVGKRNRNIVRERGEEEWYYCSIASGDVIIIDSVFVVDYIYGTSLSSQQQQSERTRKNTIGTRRLQYGHNKQHCE